MRSMWSMSVNRLGQARRAVVAVAVAVILVVAGGAVVAVLGRGPASDTRQESSSGGVVGAPTKSASPTFDAATPGRVTAGSAPDAPAPNGTPGFVAPPDASVGPRVVRTAEVTVGVAAGAFTRAFDGITAAATAQGGYVSASTAATASTVSTGSGDDGNSPRPRSGDLTLRVPSDRFDAVRTSLAGLGTVEQEQLRGDDVTAQIVDFDARLKSLQAEEEALRTLVGRATAVGEVLQVQSQLFDVRQQVERLQAQRDQLSQQASLATIHVALHEPGTVFRVPRPTTGLVRSVERAMAGASAVVGGTIVIVGWLTPAALVGLLAWAVIRFRRRGTVEVRPGPSIG